MQWGSRSRVPGCQGVGLEGPRGSRVRSTGSQGVKEWPYRVPGGQGVGLHGPMGSKGGSTKSQGVKG